MHFHLPLVLYLVASLAPATDAHPLVRTSDSIARVHRRAVKQSAGLAKDLRATFSGVRTKRATSAGSKRGYCVSSNRSNTGESAVSSPPANSSAPADASSTQSAAPTEPTTTGASANPNANATSPFKLFRSYQGKTFFDEWDFFTEGDPTHGDVDYVDRNTAQSNGLIDVNAAGHAIMRVETTPQVSGFRKSVRITTKASYTGALILLDAVHMPTGCGTWPAFWSNGPNWPTGGEIDILEGVNDYANNQATIHTASGCQIQTENSAALKISGKVVGGKNCAALETGNAGCGMTATTTNTYGVGFNQNGGGVYAMNWADNGISVFFFARNAIPADIAAGQPLPETWGTPMASWPAASCDPKKFFHDHSAIFDTTLCGDWAGNVWNSAGAPGQEQSCAERTRTATCSEFVKNNGAALAEAFWEVNYVKIFQ